MTIVLFVCYFAPHVFENVVRSLKGLLILFYCANLLIGGFLSDYFNPWIIFLVTIEIGYVLIFLLSGDPKLIALLVLPFDVIAWLAAAKYIKKCTILPSQQRLWWALLTACTSINIHLMIVFGLQKKFPWYGFVASIELSALLLGLLVLLPICKRNKQVNRSNDQKARKVTLKQLLLGMSFSIKSYKFWFIVVLNTLLMVTKWTLPLNQGIKNNIAFFN